VQTEAMNNIALQPKPVLTMFESTFYDHSLFWHLSLALYHANLVLAVLCFNNRYSAYFLL